MKQELMQWDITGKYDVDIYERTLTAGTKYPLHWHDYLEFELILSGTGEHIYNNRTYPLTRGSAYLMCYHDFHSLTAFTEIKLYSVYFNKNSLHPEYAKHLGFNQFHVQLNETETEELIYLLTKLIKELDSSLLFNEHIIKNIISEIVILMIRKSSSQPISESPLLAQQIVTYMNEHFLEKITLEEMADKLGFSPNYLGQIFKKQIGSNFNEYLHLLRLKYACSLLQATKMTVKEIAFASGYSSVEYFLYIFKTKMHMTPTDYRQQQHIFIYSKP